MVILHRHILLIAFLIGGCESVQGIQGPLALGPYPQALQTPPITVTNPSHLPSHEEQVVSEMKILTVELSNKMSAATVSAGVRLPNASPMENPFPAIFFSLDSWEINPEVREQLDVTAQWMHCFPNSGLRIEAHTDVQGTESYKMILGAKRAYAIKEYLSKVGVPVQKLETISYGKEMMVCERDGDSTCHQSNRRAELILEQWKFFIHTQSRKCMVYLDLKLRGRDPFEQEKWESALLPVSSGREHPLINKG